MIDKIKEINLPSYATLDSATVNINTMGEKTITTTMKIDGAIVPDFIGTDGKDWTLEFKGEKYILPIREPQASKGNESLLSSIDLTFYHWAIYQLKRYYFVELASVESGTAIADKYISSLAMDLSHFAVALGNVCKYYFGTAIEVDLNDSPESPYSTELSYIDIDYTYIWDVLQKIYEIYNVRWELSYNAQKGVYSIRIGYPSTELTHEFEYGYNGGLLKFERQVQSDEIKNIILGRGGEKNLPKLYFKDYEKYSPSETETSNGNFTPDPDACPELKNIYFDALRDSNFRKYVQGWNAQHGYGGASYKSGQGWAYEKGYADEKFAPVEYVKDDDSITKYGELWGALDAEDDIYPSIQNVTVEPYGRIDEVVAVSEIVTDDMDKLATDAVTEANLPELSVTRKGILGTTKVIGFVRGARFSVKEGEVGNISYVPYIESTADYLILTATDIKVLPVGKNSGEVPISSIPAGEYELAVTFHLHNTATSTSSEYVASATVGIKQVILTTGTTDTDAWKPTFDIWVKNIWNTTKGASESASDYRDRVWVPILGDREGNEATVMFSDGFLAFSQDYEFKIRSVTYDTSKSYNGVNSEWKITLIKSDAELDATGLYIPNATTGGNATAGNHFFFIGIDIPFDYVKWAENKLTEYKTTEGLSKNSEIQPSWVVTLDKVRIHTGDDDLVNQFAVGAIIDIKDKRFTKGKVLKLYISSITYTWNADSIIPNVEIVLSDQIIATKSTTEKLQGDVNVIKQSYLSVDQVYQAVNEAVGKTFLKKAGVPDTSYSPTKFAAIVTSAKFQQGSIAGSGWGFYEGVAQKSTLEIDKLIVRDELEVNNLVVNQVTAVGGKQIISAANMVCSNVILLENGQYQCFFDQKQGSIGNLFKVGDVVMGQVWDEQNTQLRYYRRTVTATTENSITITATGDGDGVPQTGDVLVQFGNDTDESRQFVIVTDVIGGGYIQMFSGLISAFSSGVEYYYAGMQNNGARVFIGSKDVNYIEYINGKLTIKADVQLVAGSDLANKVKVIDNLSNSNVLSIIEKKSLREKMREINPSKETYTEVDYVMMTGFEQKRGNQSRLVLYNGTERIKLQGMDSTGHNIVRINFDVISLNDDAKAQINLSMVLAGSTGSLTIYTDAAYIGKLDEALTFDADGNISNYKEKVTQSLVGRPTTTNKVSVFTDLSEGVHFIEIGFTQSTVSTSESAVYADIEFTGPEMPGSLFDWLQVALKEGKDFTRAEDAADELFNYLVTDCAIWEDTDTEFETNAFRDEITNLFNGYYTEINGTLQVMGDFDYLKKALGNDIGTTEISGGLVLGTFIGVKDTNTKVVAGINATELGKDATHNRLMMFAGSTDASTISESKFRVYEDGHLVAQDASIEGNIVAKTGKIGGFELTDNWFSAGYTSGTTENEFYLSSTRTTSKTSGKEFIVYDNLGGEHQSIFSSYVNLSTDEAGSTGMGRHIAGVFQTKITNPDSLNYEFGSIGLEIDASGGMPYTYRLQETVDSEYFYGNFAIFAKSGKYAGLRLETRAVGVSETVNLTRMDNTIIVAGNNATLVLPPSPQDGQLYFILMEQKYTLTIKSNGPKIWRNGYGSVSSTQHTTLGSAFDIIIYSARLGTWVMQTMSAV